MVSIFVVGENSRLMQRVMQILEVESFDSINYVNGLLVVSCNPNEAINNTVIEAFIKSKVKDMGLQHLYDPTVIHTKFSIKVKVSEYELAMCLLNSIPSFTNANANTIEYDNVKLIDGDHYNLLI